jgi:hypothetical protein
VGFIPNLGDPIGDWVLEVWVKKKFEVLRGDSWKSSF